MMRQPEKELEELMHFARAKMDELNLVNAEQAVIEKEFDELREKMKPLNERWKELEEPHRILHKQLVELRSEIQNTQTKCLSLCLELMAKGAF